MIALLREHKADYGLQRIYGGIGGMISSPLSGLLIDYSSQGKDYTDFRPAFYLYAALKTFGGLLMLCMNLEFKSASEHVFADVVAILKKIEVLALFIASFIMGIAWGYIESFLFWLLQDLGGSRSLMGITITVGGVAGLPLLALSGPIINKIGHANVIFIGFVFYAVRLLGTFFFLKTNKRSFTLISSRLFFDLQPVALSVLRSYGVADIRISVYCDCDICREAFNAYYRQQYSGITRRYLLRSWYDEKKNLKGNF